jgi:transposase
MAAMEIADLQRLDAQLKALTAELKAEVLVLGSHPMGIHGIGPAGAARILADIGDVARFADRSGFASWTGTAPIDASSGEHVRHRLSRAGNRRLNHVLHIAAVVQLRNDTPDRAYFRRKRAAGKAGLEAIRSMSGACPTPSTASSPQTSWFTAPARITRAREGHCGASLPSGAADLTPRVGASDQPQPEPRTRNATHPAGGGEDHRPGGSCRTRRRAGGVSVERPTGRTTLTPTSVGAHSSRPPDRPIDRRRHRRYREP